MAIGTYFCLETGQRSVQGLKGYLDRGNDPLIRLANARYPAVRISWSTAFSCRNLRPAVSTGRPRSLGCRSAGSVARALVPACGSIYCKMRGLVCHCARQRGTTVWAPGRYIFSSASDWGLPSIHGQWFVLWVDWPRAGARLVSLGRQRPNPARTSAQFSARAVVRGRDAKPPWPLGAPETLVRY